ncbi:MAG: hypothetical protein IJ529_02480 [Alphaproteobacteria bacterium]|nr:hypothetical protein [Alphaproteobacteria bacterium]MBR1648497.1 hypothetical protein [Alphaproteobacteria bacterium]
MPIIDRKNIKTEIGRKYYDLLVKVCGDETYLIDPLFTRIKGDEKRKKMIDIINKGVTDIPDLIEASYNVAHE